MDFIDYDGEQEFMNSSSSDSDSHRCDSDIDWHGKKQGAPSNITKA